MCGRTTRIYSWKGVRDFFDLEAAQQAAVLGVSYNVAPTQQSPIVRLDPGGGRELAVARWGLVPSWADDPSIGNRMINARAETVAAKPAFRSAFKSRRCLVPVSGFYEWKAEQGSKAKQPWYITPADGGIMCLAGLWERWDKGGEPVDSYTIITTGANEFMARLHDRMPVVVQPEDFAAWLDPATPPERLTALMVPAPDGVLDARPVSTRVNTPRNNDPSLVERAAVKPD